MFLAGGILLLLISITFHELGHALVMRKYGVELEEMGMGIKVRPYVTVHSKFFDCPIYLSPWLIGAYVKPKGENSAQDPLEALPYFQKTHCYGAGVIANFIVALAYAAFAIAIRGDIFAARSLSLLLFLTVVAGVGIVLPKFTTGILFPILGVGFALLLIQGLVSIGGDSVAGPVGIVRDIPENNLSRLLFFGSLISLSIGLTNLMPFTPLDGGHIMRTIISRFSPRLARTYQAVTGIAFFAFFVFVMIHDFM